MSSQPSPRLYVTVATGVVVLVTSVVLWCMTLYAWKGHGDLGAGRLLATGMLLVSGVPLALRGAHRARGGASEGGARWLWEIAFVVVAAVVLLLVMAGPPDNIEDCGLDGKMC
jgi:hypothetical protein